MQSGLFWGHIAMIEGMVARLKQAMRAQYGEEEVRVIGTGGLSKLFEQYTAVIDRSVPELTLEGMRLIWERAKP